nr:DUF4238 domain-containing protein [Methylobacterium soli]
MPIFYTQQWAGSDRRVCQFSRPRENCDRVVPKRVAPAGTGYVERLYELHGLIGEDAQAFESLFMKPVDDLAAKVLYAMKSGQHMTFKTREMEAWTRFLMSLWHRHPDELKSFKQHFERSWADVTPEMELDYRRRRRSSWPSTLREFMNSVPPAMIERVGMTIVADLINDRKIRERIMAMRWGSLSFPLFSNALMTSDRPLMMTSDLVSSDSFLMIPIGPKQVFYAANTDEMVNRIRRRNHHELIARLNERVVSQASRFVYAMNDVQLPYVQSQMARTPLPLLADRIADAGRERMNLTRARDQR